MKRRIAIILAVITVFYVTYDFNLGEKSVSAWSLDEKEYILGGEIVGIKLYAKGLMCIDLEEESPGKAAGLKKGDIILSADGKEFKNSSEFIKIIKGSQGDIKITFDRDGKISDTLIKPIFDEDGNGKIGLWVRDSIAGVGTVTFYDVKDGKMMSLGHSVTDADAERSFVVRKGYITDCEILSVTKGEPGSPGEICGSFPEDEKILGYITNNTEKGLISNLSGIDNVTKEVVKLGSKADLKDGEALLYSAIIDGEKRPYAVKIKKLYGAGGDFLVEITDQRLLNLTGGIVQGMSGSPIIQNGKLVGAVTHVFVNDPTRGYGIFIENMLDEAMKVN